MTRCPEPDAPMPPTDPRQPRRHPAICQRQMLRRAPAGGPCRRSAGSRRRHAGSVGRATASGGGKHRATGCRFACAKRPDAALAGAAEDISNQNSRRPRNMPQPAIRAIIRHSMLPESKRNAAKDRTRLAPSRSCTPHHGGPDQDARISKTGPRTRIGDRAANRPLTTIGCAMDTTIYVRRPHSTIMAVRRRRQQE